MDTERELKRVKIIPRIVFQTVRFLIDFQSVVQTLISQIDFAEQIFCSQNVIPSFKRSFLTLPLPFTDNK